MKRKRYPRKFQRMAVERMRTCEDVGELAKELGVTRRCLYKWRAKLDLVETPEESARPHTREAPYRKQVRKLELHAGLSRNRRNDRSVRYSLRA